MEVFQTALMSMGCSWPRNMMWNSLWNAVHQEEKIATVQPQSDALPGTPLWGRRKIFNARLEPSWCSSRSFAGKQDDILWDAMKMVQQRKFLLSFGAWSVFRGVLPGMKFRALGWNIARNGGHKDYLDYLKLIEQTSWIKWKSSPCVGCFLRALAY